MPICFGYWKRSEKIKKGYKYGLKGFAILSIIIFMCSLSVNLGPIVKQKRYIEYEKEKYETLVERNNELNYIVNENNKEYIINEAHKKGYAFPNEIIFKEVR